MNKEEFFEYVEMNYPEEEEQYNPFVYSQSAGT